MTNAAKKTMDPIFIEPEVNAKLGESFGLNENEYKLVVQIIGRKPTYTELGIFSVMWSEHCSYKSSRLHLKKLPTTAPWVIQGPGENAGVIDIGDNEAAIFKMESHNSPSAIEPYQGAATGVGGILRDIFTMGARPVAAVNALRFGSTEHPKTKHYISGVVAGIAGYGNCFGVPTVAGETEFHPCYNSNPLVNAMVVGTADQDLIYYSKGAGIDMPVVYVGAKTGRDGIHGATMSSKAFDSDEKRDEERPTVQVGDPFTEKLLLEACLELMKTDAIISIQDMGAAGLTSSCVEIADKGNIGVTLELDQVPQRELNMTPYELMLSESQERMLMILKPGYESEAEAIFQKWDLDFAVIGRTTEERQLVLNMYGKTWCDIPVPPLVDDAPIYDRPQEDYPAPEPIEKGEYSSISNEELKTALEKIMNSPNMASKAWIWEQYDSLVRGQTVATPGIVNTQNGKAADAALVKVSNDSSKALAISSDCTPRYCHAEPYEGGKQAVAESYRNICATGAKPLAITNNLNFGNPERPEIMAQFVGCIEGMAEACKELDYPVISGNVSLYNETKESAIHPTPVIGGVGLISNYDKSVGLALEQDGLSLYLIGDKGGHLGQSLYLREVHDKEIGHAPYVDLVLERRNGEFIREAVDAGLISSCHDISDGGLLCAIAEMCIAGGRGASLDKVTNANDPGVWFGEDQGRYIIATSSPDEIENLAKNNDVKCTLLGETGGNDLKTKDVSWKISNLREIHDSWLPDYLDADK